MNVYIHIRTTRCSGTDTSLLSQASLSAGGWQYYQAAALRVFFELGTMAQLRYPTGPVEMPMWHTPLLQKLLTEPRYNVWTALTCMSTATLATASKVFTSKDSCHFKLCYVKCTQRVVKGDLPLHHPSVRHCIYSSCPHIWLWTFAECNHS